MNQTQAVPVTNPTNYNFLISRLERMGYPREYAHAAVHSLSPKLPTARAALQAIQKCREWLYNPFLRDCPPVDGIIAIVPTHWEQGKPIDPNEVLRAAIEYNMERGIIVFEEAGV